jgi:P27 family predicted phage terminase small subunit
VFALKKSRTKPPETLSPEARTWWTRILGDYQITDEAGLLLLETALTAFDRMRQAQECIAKHGPVQEDRFGQLRANPATTIERDSRAAMLAAVKALNLDMEPLNDRPGRPSGSR